MQDEIIKFLAYNGKISVVCINSTEMVEKARKIHDLSPVTTAAFGRMLTMTAIMANEMKNAKDKITIQIKGNGPIQMMLTTANNFPKIKGYVANPVVDLPLNEFGKLDVGQAIGNGYINVIKDIGLKEPYIGICPLVSGEIAEDFAEYFAKSEQKNTAVALGVLVDKNGVKSAGGYIITPMPDATDEEISKIEQSIFKAGAISRMLDEKLSLIDIAKKVTGDENVEVIEEGIRPVYECDCSKENMADALATLDETELKQMIEEDGKAELVCHFCNKKYDFSKEELEGILEKRRVNKMENKILIFGHKNPDTDTICSALVKEILNKKKGCEKSKAVRLGNLNKETQYALKYLGLEEPELIEKVEEGQEVILVDHNEFNQSVEGIEKAKILEVVDHHRISNFETSEPLYYTARPFGCTSTILFEEFKQNNIEIEKIEAVLMASAIISDTLLLKSPTTTEHDRKALEELGKIADINIEEYGLEMLKAGTDLDDFSEEELINLDAKSLDKNGTKFVIAQVNTVSIEDVLKRKEKLEVAMNKEIEEKGLSLFVLAITDILNSNSEIIALGEKADAVEKGFEKKLENNTVFLEGVVSRKKQLLPSIDKNI